MRREELERMGQGHMVDILGEEVNKIGKARPAGTLEKLEARFEEIQKLFGEIAGDGDKEKEFNEKYGREYHLLNDEIQDIKRKQY